MFDWSYLQQMFGNGGQGLLQGNPMQAYQGQQGQGMPPNLGNPYAMGIPTQPQASAPYQQYSPYTSGSPYTMTGTNSPPLPQGLPSFQDYFNPFQTLRQDWQDQNALDYTNSQQPVAPPAATPDPGGYMAGGWGDAPHWVVGPKPAGYDDPKQQWYRSQSG